MRVIPQNGPGKSHFLKVAQLSATTCSPPLRTTKWSWVPLWPVSGLMLLIIGVTFPEIAIVLSSPYPLITSVTAAKIKYAAHSPVGKHVALMLLLARLSMGGGVGFSSGVDMIQGTPAILKDGRDAGVKPLS